MEANHVHRWHGKERRAGSGAFLYQRHPAREDAALSVGVEALPGFQAAVVRAMQVTA